MGDLAADTAVEHLGGGRYRATLSKDWEIWGPMGGYVAAVALRAVGEASPFERPASFSCHYLGVAAFDAVDVEVEPLRLARQAASHRVSITQDGRPILDALVWSVAADVEGLEHDVGGAPQVPGPDELPSPAELSDAPPPFPFWRNFDVRPLMWVQPWPPPEPLEPLWREWLRFDPWEPGRSPWVEAARLLLLADLPSWPSGGRHHAWRQPPFIAPTLDLQVSFVRLAPEEPWLLVEGTSPVACDGMMPFTSRVWSTDGRLLAAGGGQTLFRRVRPPAAPG